jgi:fibrillarin-like rRNA methylase
MSFIKCINSLFRVIFCLVAATTAPLVAAYPAHYFVINEAQDGTLSVAYHQIVNLSGIPENNLSQNAAKTSSTRLESYVNAAAYSKANDKLVSVTTAASSPWLRAEFPKAGTSGEIEGRTFPAQNRQYVVRMPVESGQLLRLSGTRHTEVTTSTSVGNQSGIAQSPPVAMQLELDLDSYISAAKASVQKVLPAGYSSGALADNGDPANRLDLLIVAEGYTAQQQDKFLSDASSLATKLLSISPYRDFKHLINVRWLFVPSAQSGADKPNCVQTPLEPVVMVDTAFDATFCTAGLRRLITFDYGKLNIAASNVPDWDYLLLLVNDNEYGGAGGFVSVASTNQASSEVMQHELGHSFTLLADEYEEPYPEYGFCSDINTSLPKCEVNVTDQTSLASLKWRRWVGSQTPIPTPMLFPLTDPKAAGLWLGARYTSFGMYRQCLNGIMRSLGAPFCDVDSEAFVKRLFSGWYSLPNGVSLINPGATPSVATVMASRNSTVLFQATLSGSLAGLTATWSVDGIVKSVQNSTHGATVSFAYLKPDDLEHSVLLDVSDNTGFTLDRPSRSRFWQVKGRSSGDLNADGKSDLIFRNASTGQINAWLMNGIVSSATGVLVPPGNWTVSHVADFSGDGSADVLIRSNDGAVSLLLMNALTVTSNVSLLGAGSGWSVSHVADFNGDGKADLLWRNTDGSVALWLMNGTAQASSALLIGANSGWGVTHTADFNGDGKADLLWRNTDGTIAAWLMNGTAQSSSGGLLGAGSGWNVSHVADFNGDGKADLLWRSTDGTIAMWLMNGIAQSSSDMLLGGGSGWNVSHVVDFNSDGKDDLLWRKSDGTVTIWLMNGTVQSSNAFLIGANSGWNVTHTADMNGDGKGDLIWRNTGDGSVAIWLMDGTTTMSATGILGATTWNVVPSAP